MKPMVVMFAALIAALAAPLMAQAADLLSPSGALTAAVAILKGDPYGRTFNQVARNIVASQLLTGDGARCSGTTGPVWEFHVVVPANRDFGGNPIDGNLGIDARTGERICASLPYLD